jgi:sugar O-acyltransferase (sialic acid O-acetyltransferase NeuD family)
MKRVGLIIVGDTAFAEIAHEYFTHDSKYEVVAFSVERAFMKRRELKGLPVVPFEEIESKYSVGDHEVHVAVTYTQLNRLRARLCEEAKSKGFRLASYVSSRAFVWRNVVLGEHCFIFEDNTIQPFATVGNNVVLWSGNHIGHHSIIHDNCFIASQVVISGFCEIGANSFLGVNCTVANNIRIGRDNWIGPGVTISKETATGELYARESTKAARVSSLRFFKVKD